MYVMGINPTAVRTSAEGPEFALGTLGATAGSASGYTSPMSGTGTTAGTKTGPKVYMYVQFAAGGATGEGYAVIVNPATFVATLITGTLAAAAAGQRFPVGVARAAVAGSGYGWVQVYGQTTVVAANGTAIGTRLATHSGTAGILVTGVSATGAYLIDGVTLTSAGVTATPVAGWVNWPEVGVVV